MAAAGHYFPEDQAKAKTTGAKDFTKSTEQRKGNVIRSMVAEGHHLPEDQAKPRQQEQSHNKEHKAKNKECYDRNGGRRPPSSRRPGKAKTTGEKPQQITQSKEEGMLLNEWWPKAVIFQKTRQIRDNRNKAITKNTKERKGHIIE